jgi:hypothetical protein
MSMVTNVQARPKRSPRKRLSFYLVYLVSLLLFSAIAAEALARLTGHHPWVVKQADIRVEPGGKFYQTHPTLGYRHLPGEFRVTLNGACVFKATNLANTLRITHPLATYPAPDAKKEIWIFGDSVTYGWSVNDEETFPWLLQEKFPDYEVVNFGVQGYSTLNSLIQLREALQNGKKPRLVILSYASWDEARNTFIRSRRKMLSIASYLGPVDQPYARLNDDGKLNIFMDAETYREFPLMRYSAFVHALEESYDGYEERHAHSHEVTKAIVREISELCRRNGIELVVAGLTSDSITSDMLLYCQREGIRTTSIWVDLSIKENNNLPYDSHPSALAHKQYAEKLESFLRSIL